MLVLTRRVGETLVIGDNEVKIQVVSVKNGQVKFAIDAPKHVEVNRQEIYEAKKKQPILA